MTQVLVFGTFDCLHPGHVFFLEYARSRGEELVVVVARDETVRRVKSRAPVQSESRRREALAAHALVDSALLGGLGDKYAVIEQVRPDKIVLGYDQHVFTKDLVAELAARGLSCVVERFEESLRPDVFKSSLLREA